MIQERILDWSKITLGKTLKMEGLEVQKIFKNLERYDKNKTLYFLNKFRKIWLLKKPKMLN